MASTYKYRSAAALTCWVVALLGLMASHVVVLLWIKCELGWAPVGVRRVSSIWTPNRGEPRELLMCHIVLEMFGVWGHPLVIVLFGRWLQCANRNARAAGAEGMRFTPGWCVGWLFVPVFNLFRPYQGVRELWTASTPIGEPVTVSPLLGLWWSAWLALCSVSVAVGVFLWGTNHHVPFELAITWDAVYVLACLSAIGLVWRIHRRLERRWRAS